MYKINRSALVAFSDQKMFDLINDVENYQEFLPWCGGSKILDETSSTRTGAVTIAFKGVNKTFTTKNTLTPYKQIGMQMVDGPFSTLQGTWAFKKLDDDACKISLDLEFDFSNSLVGVVIGPVFKTIANSMLDSFIKRAESLYS